MPRFAVRWVVPILLAFPSLTQAGPFVVSATVPWPTMAAYGCQANNPASPACLAAYHSVCVTSGPSGTYTAGIGPLTFTSAGVSFLCVRPGQGVGTYTVHDGSMTSMSPAGLCQPANNFASPACTQAAVRYCDANGLRGGQVVTRVSATGMSQVLCGTQTYLAQEVANYADLNNRNSSCDASNGDSPILGSASVYCRMAAKTYCQHKNPNFLAAIAITPFLPTDSTQRDSQALHFACVSNLPVPAMYNQFVKFSDYLPPLETDLVDVAWGLDAAGNLIHPDRTRHSFRTGADGHPYYILFKGNRPDQGTVYKYDKVRKQYLHWYDPTIPSYRYDSGESTTVAARFADFPHVNELVRVGQVNKISTYLWRVDPATCQPQYDVGAGIGYFFAPIFGRPDQPPTWVRVRNRFDYQATVKVNYIGPKYSDGLSPFYYSDVIELELMRNCDSGLGECRKEVEVYQRGRGLVSWKLIKADNAVEPYAVRDEGGNFLYWMQQNNPWENTNRAPGRENTDYDNAAVNAGFLTQGGERMYPSAPYQKSTGIFPPGGSCEYSPAPF